MAEIPLDKEYLRKHYPDKYKELEKNKASSPASQSKDNKHCSKAETPSPIFTIGEELQDFYYGGIKPPTEFDKYIDLSKGGGPREFKISETARLAKMSGYVVKHLRRWEQEKVTGTIEHIYRAYLHPFTYRVKQIEPDCERMKPLLALRMNTIRDNFEERYKNLLFVAKKAEEKRDHNFRDAIEEFKVATIILCDTVQMIHNEALLRIVEHSKLQGTGRNNAPAKRGMFKRIIGWILKKTWHLIVAIIVAIIAGLIVAILIDIFGDFGWIERIKAFIYNILQLE